MACLADLFLLLNNIPLCEFTTVYSSIEVYLDCVQVLEIMNKVAVNIHVQIFEWTLYLRLEHNITLLLQESSKLLSRVAAPFAFPSAMNEFLWLHVLVSI